jgi:hypothetical protein
LSNGDDPELLLVDGAKAQDILELLIHGLKTVAIKKALHFCKAILKKKALND